MTSREKLSKDKKCHLKCLVGVVDGRYFHIGNIFAYRGQSGKIQRSSNAPQSRNAEMPCSSHALGLPRWHSGVDLLSQGRSCKQHGVC